MSEFSREEVIQKIINGESLQGADLSGVDLSGVNFTPKADGGRCKQPADLRSTNLINANLSETLLPYASLRKANLRKANLRKVDFYGADLRLADFRQAFINSSTFFEANLVGAIFEGASLIGTQFAGSDLTKTQFTNAILWGADFLRACLTEADLSFADLDAAVLTYADLRRADLTYTNLSSADFENADLSNADISGANIYHIKTQGWKIEGIVCTHAYQCHPDSVHPDSLNYPDEFEKSRINFGPGAFEDTFQSLPTIEMVFQKGLSPRQYLKLVAITEILRKAHPHIGLDIKSMEKVGLETILRLTLHNDDDLFKASQLIAGLYKKRAFGESFSPVLKDHGIQITKSVQLEDLAHISVTGVKLNGQLIHFGTIDLLLEELGHFSREYSVLLREAAGRRGGMLIINNRQTTLSSIEYDLCLKLAIAIKDTWFGKPQTDRGWVSYKDLRAAVHKWKGSKEIDEDATGRKDSGEDVIKVISRINIKIRKALKPKKLVRDLIENGKNYQWPHHYRFTVHPENIELD